MEKFSWLVPRFMVDFDAGNLFLLLHELKLHEFESNQYCTEENSNNRFKTFSSLKILWKKYIYITSKQRLCNENCRRIASIY